MIIGSFGLGYSELGLVLDLELEFFLKNQTWNKAHSIFLVEPDQL